VRVTRALTHTHARARSDIVATFPLAASPVAERDRDVCGSSSSGGGEEGEEVTKRREGEYAAGRARRDEAASVFCNTPLLLLHLTDSPLRIISILA